MQKYGDLVKSMRQVEQQLREYRLAMVLKMVIVEKEKKSGPSKIVIDLERQLTSELSKQLQSPIVIDGLIDELLDLLLP